MTTAEGGLAPVGNAVSGGEPVAGRGPARTVPAAGVLGVALLAGVLGYAQAWRVSLWSDEVATISAARRSPGELVDLIGRLDAVHGLYYAGMHVWVSVAGASAASVRLPSALAVALAAAGVVVLATRLTDTTTGVLAGVVFAVLPRVTWAAIEARPWAATLALAVWATIALHAACTRDGRWRWVLYGVLGALGVACNIYLVMLWLAHGATVLLVCRDRLRRWLVTAVAAAVAVGGLVFVAAGQGGQLGTARLGVVGLLRNVVVNQWFLGETPTATTGPSAGDPLAAWMVASVVLALGTWAVVGWAVLRGRGTHRELLTWTVPWLVLPTVVVLLASAYSASLYNARYLTFCAPALAILVAAGLRMLARRWAVVVGLALLLACVPVYASQRGVLAKSSADLALAAEQLREHARPGEAVYFGPRDDAVDGVVHRSLRTVAIGYPDSTDGLLDVTLLRGPAQGGTLFGTSTTLAASMDRLEDAETVWVVRRQDRPEEAAADDNLLHRAGYRTVSRWDGPTTQVVEMRR